jgi:hypothetical protein
MSTRGFTVLERRQAWRIIRGTYYRETVVRRSADGALRLFLIPDGKVGEL